LNGAAAHLGNVGDLIIALTYTLVSEEEADKHVSRTALVDRENKITDLLTSPSTL
jgi:aspartate 1-decarboxylase